MAAMSVANIVKTSLGPVGLDKMLVDDVGVRSRISVTVMLVYITDLCLLQDIS